MSREQKIRENRIHEKKERHSRPTEITNSIDEDGVLISSRDAAEGWSSGDRDIFAAGTPGGGSSAGGLAGTNVGDAAPGNANIDDALGDGEFDHNGAREWPLSDREAHVDVADEDID